MKLYEANIGENYYIKNDILTKSNDLANYLNSGTEIKVLTHTYNVGPTVVEFEDNKRFAIPYTLSKRLELTTNREEIKKENYSFLERLALVSLVRSHKLD